MANSIAVFLAPHYDDVALSCGGTVAALARAGSRPLIITIFGGRPTTPLTPFARQLHAQWGLSDEQVIATRQSEDSCADQALGAESRWLDFPDAIYRAGYYQTEAALFDQVHANEHDLPERIEAALTRLDGEPLERASRIYVPLGVGNHVDHQLIVALGQRLVARGREVWTYEDFPYAGDPAGRESVSRLVASRTTGDVETQYLETPELERRVQAVLCYRSQLDVIFRHQGDPAEATRRYALASGGGVAQERFWRLRYMAETPAPAQ